MQKIISVFQRNYETDRLIRDEVVPGAEWVLAGEGRPTQKLDGTCCLVRDGKLFKRYEVKPGKKPPVDFEPATDVDETTGKQQGWVPVGDGPNDKWHREAWANLCEDTDDPRDGTYELLGPSVQGNPEGSTYHVLIGHDCSQDLGDCPRTFDGIREFMRPLDIEGIVFHHPDGRMAKVKKKDYGMKRKLPT
jgi:hypothetical protein